MPKKGYKQSEEHRENWIKVFSNTND